MKVVLDNSSGKTKAQDNKQKQQKNKLKKIQATTHFGPRGR